MRCADDSIWRQWLALLFGILLAFIAAGIVILALALYAFGAVTAAFAYQKRCTRDSGGNVRCVCSDGVRARWEC